VESVILVADNLHGLNPVVAEAMKKLDKRPIRDLALRCETAGARMIDINPGHLSKRNEDRMAFLVEAVQEATHLRIVLDSPNPAVLAAGLSVCQEKAVLNALSLETQKVEEILPLAAEHRTDLVVLLMDHRSFVPAAIEEKVALAVELRERCLAAGLQPDDLIYDPVLPNLSWEDAFFRIAEDVKAIRLLSSGALFQDPSRTMTGLSNLRSWQTRRFPLTLETACLTVLAGSGLTYALANVFQPELMATFRLVNRMI